eukprot:TRINITY_DN38644_c0_g1_i1.p2 TRINITY_DN38644_c0_g1~~TRINITY_DN38644_c0_g1_i1.p2  ORF type:complete len:131 (-),score=33.80 TRINITY_DN38644_c0_g1_i1:69-461(-)
MIRRPQRSTQGVSSAASDVYKRQSTQSTWGIQNVQLNKYDKMNIKPLADRVVIMPAPAEEKTASGIIIPDSAKEKPQKGKVVAVGPGTKDEEMQVSIGDEVLYGKYAGTCLLYTSPSPRDLSTSRMPSSA